MFAGLPGIGVGTLFYILISFSMPFRELPRVFQGTSSLDTWKKILRQMFYSVGIIISIMFAERLMLWVLGDNRVNPFSPATWLYAELRNQGLFGAPIMASVILLVTIVGSVEVMRIIMKRPERIREEKPSALPSAFPEGVLD